MTGQAADGVAPWPSPSLDPRETNRCIQRLITAAGGYHEDAHAVVGELGLPLVARILANEIAFRAALPRNPVPLRVALSITFRGRSERVEFAVVKDEPVRIDSTGEGELSLHAEYEAVELLRQVFGPSRVRRAGARATQFTPRPDGSTDVMPTPEVLLQSWHANNVVLSACAADSPGIGDLADRYLTDKGGGLHWFTPHYQHHFAEFRDRPVRLLEIGIGEFHLMPGVGGGSLKTWKRYFRRGMVCGIDIYDKSHLDQPRLTTLRGDQNDAEFLRSVVREHGPFDIVIDDGSHINEHVHHSFRTLWPQLAPGGLYVIEDLWTSFVPGYGGTDSRPAVPGTSLGLLKSLVDGIHYEENNGRTALDSTDAEVVGVHVYHNVAFIEKGVNAEGGIPLWVDRNPVY
ncbi:class I SAM-dependent methyltransferase [Amycolatopsis rubida]|uniref:Demethylmacrocin O-methyltransferase n=1 Tax=Amycolatopsis rubida TaxID=112413 RepID=A0A1I5TLK7_9PSEU|nr:class I SAM-dependent methyltransferase [Amycolatopsis rubida]SFP83964.1 demethylmacrocin O-methyltransferase [Amycolatopsis rubida]